MACYSVVSLYGLPTVFHLSVCEGGGYFSHRLASWQISTAFLETSTDYGNFSLPYQTLITDLDWACEMLQCGTQLLKDGLSKRTVQAGNERVSTHLTSVQVCFSLLKSI